MTELSPAAQATYDAFHCIGLYNEPSLETNKRALAAALRAAATMLRAAYLGEEYVKPADDWLEDIAAELEAQQPPSPINPPQPTEPEGLTDIERERQEAADQELEACRAYLLTRPGEDHGILADELRAARRPKSEKQQALENLDRLLNEATALLKAVGIDGATQ
jgi:transposase